MTAVTRGLPEGRGCLSMPLSCLPRLPSRPGLGVPAITPHERDCLRRAAAGSINLGRSTKPRPHTPSARPRPSGRLPGDRRARRYLKGPLVTAATSPTPTRPGTPATAGPPRSDGDTTAPAGKVKLPPVVWLLGAVSFVMSTSSLIVAGLLPQISDSLGVSVSSAGLLITVYALGMGIGAPVMSLATLRLPHRSAMIAALVHLGRPQENPLALLSRRPGGRSGNSQLIVAGRVQVELLDRRRWRTQLGAGRSPYATHRPSRGVTSTADRLNHALVRGEDGLANAEELPPRGAGTTSSAARGSVVPRSHAAGAGSSRNCGRFVSWPRGHPARGDGPTTVIERADTSDCPPSLMSGVSPGRARGGIGVGVSPVSAARRMPLGLAAVGPAGVLGRAAAVSVRHPRLQRRRLGVFLLIPALPAPAGRGGLAVRAVDV